MSDILCVGAGITGAVIARELADNGFRVTVIDERNHPAGNCHCERDSRTGVMVHVYGPHIFHTSDTDIWEYVNRFARFVPFVNRVKASVRGKIYTLPINLHTINQFFEKNFSPLEAEKFLQEKAAERRLPEPRSFEEQGLGVLGTELYEAFFKGYTIKQWGIDPRDLPASIFRRLPVRFTYDDNYYSDRFQGIPPAGYTAVTENILDSEGIDVLLNRRFEEIDIRGFLHVFYTGRLDRYFRYCHGPLAYRTLDFKHFHPEEHPSGGFQGCAVMNYCDLEVPFTRIVEHRHFAPGRSPGKTICTREFSRECRDEDVPFYPVRKTGEDDLLQKYKALAKKEEKVTFAGRLGTHRYLNMDEAIGEAIKAAKSFLASRG